jgi:hypothetical protein
LNVTPERSSIAYSGFVMRGAFVVQLVNGTQPNQGQFEGWVEEVDSGMQLRFRSTDELVTFLTRRMQAVCRREDDQENDPENENPAGS